ncbi:MAG: tetratricopeptide repeat protein, partial [Proteobacteria bacterium]|nr:tetratricopeptide repeat protein [Pseudomonadota bacterium]
KILEIVKKSIVIPSKIYLLMSDYYLIDDQYDQAEQSILDAIRIEPEDMSLKYHLVQFHIATENNSKAESILETILKNQEDIYLKMMLSDVYILNNKLNKAEKIILELKEEIKESTTEFELLQGKFWLYSGRPVDATSHFKSALELKPGLVNVRYLLGLTHLINEKNKLSENTLVRTLQIHPNHYNALLLISELFYKKKEYSLSLQYLDRLLENYPEDFTGYIIKGLNLLGQKKYSLAKKEFATSLHLSSRTYASYYYLGMTEELMDNDIAALEYYKQVLKIDPDLIDASYRYCMLLLKMKQNKTANDFIDKRLTIRKNSPEVYYLAGKVAQKTGNLSKAEEFLKKAIQFYSAPGFVYMELASFYKNNHEIQKAIEILKQCTVRKPYFQDAWLVLCEFYVDSQDLTTALEIMQEGYKKFQGSPIFQSNLAWLLLEDNQQINKAFSLAQSAYEKMPDNIAFADTLGWAYYKKGIYSQAIWLLSEIEKKEPDNGLIQYHLGMTYYQQGEIEKTIEHLKIAQKSESVKYFLHEIDRAFSEISKINKDELEIKIAVDKDSILLPPEIENVEDNKILPQWK